ncbi:MAG: PspC domain-containing protein [Oscillochloridaceae bacterium]|nr:PspC domain-containing protein [Chloroflexaceae bacterium]MDW8391711.1 PspC domain-containing protein [Oscillochloridaceae bacterium]
MQPRLRRSATESMVAGVCGGLAEYFNIDPAIVRLIFVVVTLTSGLGLPAYLILWVVMPRAAPASMRQLSGAMEQSAQRARTGGGEAPDEAPVPSLEQFAGQPSGMEGSAEQPAPPPESAGQPERRHARWRTLGLILIGIGGLVLLDQFGIDTSLLFPALLIVAGVILLQRQR